MNELHLRPTSLKAIHLPLLGLIAAATTANSYGFAEIARGALLLQTTASGTYESYFIGSPDNDSDIIYSLAPTLQYSRRAGLATWQGEVGMAFVRYDKNKSYDSDDIRASGAISLPTAPGARLSGGISGQYREETVVDYMVNDRVPTKTMSGNFNLEYRLGVRGAITENFGYSQAYRDFYSDQENISNDLGFTYYEFLEATNLTVTHGFYHVTSSGDNFRDVPLDQTSNSLSTTLSRALTTNIRGDFVAGYHIMNRSQEEVGPGGDRTTSGSFFSLGINGPFLPPSRFPKLKSSANISYRQSQAAGLGDTNERYVSGDVSLSWQARERTSVSLNASRSTNLTSGDITALNTSVGGSVSQEIGLYTSADAGVSYSWIDYRGTGQSDGTFMARAGIGRSLGKHFSIGASYEYRTNQTDTAGFGTTRFTPKSYDRHTVNAYISSIF